MTLSHPATGAPAQASSAAAEPFLRLSAVHKSYPGVLALNGLDLEIRAGEVIGLVGENGAGKSTLMKILGGVTTPDSGSIEVDGVPYAALTVGGSLRAGVTENPVTVSCSGRWPKICTRPGGRPISSCASRRAAASGPASPGSTLPPGKAICPG